MIIAAEVQHTVRHQKGKLPLFGVSVQLCLFLYPVCGNDDVPENQFPAVRVKIIRLSLIKTGKSDGVS